MTIDLPVNILLVDDRRENLLALEALLNPLGHNLVKAVSGEEALKCLLHDDFAVILLDVQMPGIDGFETAELIRGRERSQDTPIIFLTAINTSAQHIARGYAIGAVDYLLKPIVPEILLSKVAVFVDLHKKTEKVRGQAAQLEATVLELEHQIVERAHTEQALRQARDELEQRVRERTAGLAAANDALRAEVAERKRAEQERARLLGREQRARADAEQAVRARDQFLSIASHELKTPLTTLLGNLQLLQRRAAREGGIHERHQRSLEIVAQQATRLKKLVEALLDISRIQNGQLTITRQSLDLAALTRRVVEEIRPMLDQHRIEQRFAREPPFVSGEKLRLEQVLQNLIQNAVKYSPMGGTITVLGSEREDWACVTVRDHGIGIPEESLSHLFQRFYRAENADAQHISGMGVGLYVVKEIILLHGGEVEVTSTEGEGSSFTICLPRLDEELVVEQASADSNTSDEPD